MNKPDLEALAAAKAKMLADAAEDDVDSLALLEGWAAQAIRVDLEMQNDTGIRRTVEQLEAAGYWPC